MMLSVITCTSSNQNNYHEDTAFLNLFCQLGDINLENEEILEFTENKTIEFLFDYHATYQFVCEGRDIFRSKNNLTNI